MSAFIGREREMRLLEQQLERPGDAFVIVSGRRRIGKTRLLKAFCRGRPSLYFQAVQTADGLQLDSFSKAVGQFSGEKQLRFADWESALDHFARCPIADSKDRDAGKRILVFDDFPCMVRSQPALPSILQKVWDQTLCEANIAVILCGSDMSSLASGALGEFNPLFRRASLILEIAPLSYLMAAEFLPNYEPNEQLLAYSILGGSPFNLHAFSDRKSIKQNVVDHILSMGATLHEEPPNLIARTFREPTRYNDILQAIALGAPHFTEISQRSLIVPASLSKYLNSLASAGFVEKEVPLLQSAQDQSNARRRIYKIADNYLKFWFRFVRPFSTRSGIDDEEDFWDEVIAPQLSEFASSSFEDACRQYLLLLNRRKALPFRLNEIGRWWNGAAEIDILGADRLRRQFILGECKFKSSAMTPADLRKLDLKRAAIAAIPPDAEVHRWLFSRSGFSDDLRRMAEADPRLHLTTLGELYSIPG